ncbi:MAG: ankyrin repeat domain-containing protein [Acidobacteriota bacterium]|nr:ankyrin repeat domain-containing protein [Acidobacteriota bacterium]
MLVGAAAVFVGRIVYEETILTWLSGPQMVGFALAHGALPFILVAGLIGLPGSLLWVAVSLVLLIRKRFRVPFADWIPIVLVVLLVMTSLIPYETWEELTVRIAGPGSHGCNFLVQAAGQDKRRFVTLLLRKGCDINYENGGGTTALSGASVLGREEMVNFLVSKGADANRKDRLSGQTPLMAAAGMGQLGTTKGLLKNGADPCRTDKDGHTAEGLAKKYGHGEIAEYLSSQYHCPEKVILVPCIDSAVSACVHP